MYHCALPVHRPLTRGLLLTALCATFVISRLAHAQQASTAAKGREDAFSTVHCGADVVKSLIGGRLPDGRAAAIEAAHADIKLKDVGGSEITDDLFLAGWQLCGHEYQLLVSRDRVSDVILFPPHSGRQPAFLGSCTLQAKQLKDVLAVLDNPSPRVNGRPPYPPDDTTLLAVISAWRIDVAGRRFVPVATAGLRCPRGGIFTSDGGT